MTGDNDEYYIFTGLETDDYIPTETELAVLTCCLGIASLLGSKGLLAAGLSPTSYCVLFCQVGWGEEGGGKGGGGRGLGENQTQLSCEEEEEEF